MDTNPVLGCPVVADTTGHTTPSGRPMASIQGYLSKTGERTFKVRFRHADKRAGAVTFDDRAKADRFVAMLAADGVEGALQLSPGQPPAQVIPRWPGNTHCFRTAPGSTAHSSSAWKA